MKENWSAVEFHVHGRVQGVGFRYFTVQTANALGLCGWVKNMPDGTVLCRAAGTSAAMDAFRRKLQQGPTFSKVTRIDETVLDQGPGHNDFRVIY